MKKWRQLSLIDAIWLCSDLDGTNFYKFYGRFEEIGLLYLVSVFHWLCNFGVDVLLGINEIRIEFICECRSRTQIRHSLSTLNCDFLNYYSD